MTTSTDAATTAASADETGDPRPSVRIAATLRRAITAGAIPPGTLLHQAGIAPRFHAPVSAAVQAFSMLRGEQLVIWRKSRWYAAPGGPPGADADARLGAALTRLRTAAGKTPDELADAIPSRNAGIYLFVFARDVRAAEDGAWQPRHFWEGCDTALGADGTLLRLHDSSYNPARAGNGPDAGSGHDGTGDYLPPPPAPPGLHPVAGRVAAEISVRIAAGHWPPGTPLPTQSALAAEHFASTPFIGQALMELAGQGLLTRVPSIGYLTPGTDHRPPPAVIAVVLEWDNGTRTRLTCTPAHPHTGHLRNARPPSTEQTHANRSDEEGGLVEDKIALDLLAQIWGGTYDTGCDAGTWWYRRKDGNGGTYIASSAGELHQMIADDHASMPDRTAS